MRVALYARTTAADGQDNLDVLLAGLAAHAAQRGWDIVLQCTDPGPGPKAREKASDASPKPSVPPASPPSRPSSSLPSGTSPAPSATSPTSAASSPPATSP